ncbi:hypothetical protein [Tomitella gaofuii]|uniref:hypothetical protein n=1 Tax=Tomitella gaofuii TaxID=2760083 RepID=UPI0015F9A97B|nr:hypothetical protein [Tomitella gaofuii]
MNSGKDLGSTLKALPDGEFYTVLSDAINQRAAMSAVRIPLLSLVASGPTLSAAIRSAVSDEAAATAVARAHIETAARQALFTHPHYEAADVADVLGSQDKNRRSLASRLRNRGDIIGYLVAGRHLYPAFQFDVATARVRPVVADINRRLDAKNDPWAVASWWLSPSGWLADGTSPADLAVAGGQDDTIRTIADDLLED